jgi:hypothetical protein
MGCLYVVVTYKARHINKEKEFWNVKMIYTKRKLKPSEFRNQMFKN